MLNFMIQGVLVQKVYMILKFLTPCYVKIRSYKRYQIHIYTYIGELRMIVIWKKKIHVIIFKLQTRRTASVEVTTTETSCGSVTPYQPLWL
jgi:hypothetical protein